ncbi:MAG: TolC family protein [Treponema sp.]|jgi:outer membrane protein TolC|nr:TolC family protein [Treponema sp.]
MNLAKRHEQGQFANTLKYPIILFFLSIVLCANIAAQQASAQSAAQSAAPLRLSPEEAVERALKNNLSLESSRTGIETKKRASDLSWNQFIPSVTVANILSRDNKANTASGVVPVEQIPLNPLYTNPMTGASMLPDGTPNFYGVVPYSVELPKWHIAGSIQTSLNINMAMFENMKRLKLDYENGLLTYEKSKALLERDVRKAYHNMLLLQENIILLRSSFENVERQVQMALANYNAGLAPELTYLQARVARENMKPAIDQAESGLKLMMAQFAMYLGLDYNTPFELIPAGESADFISLDVADMISKAAAGKPDIKELKHTILMLQTVRKTQVYALTPSLGLSWNLNSAFIKNPWKDSWFSSDDWMTSGSFTISIGVRLHSLIPWSADYQGIKNLDDQIKTANIGLGQLIRGTEIEIYNTVLSLERTRVSAQAQEQTIALAQQSYNLTEQAYQAGLQDLFQVQNAEQSLRQARVQMLEQQFNYLNGLIDLEYSIGVPFGTLSSKEKK